MPKSRNRIVNSEWVLEKLDNYDTIKNFDCNDKDLNEYFRKDVKAHREQLLTKTYKFYDKHIPGIIVALADFCNDCVRREKISRYDLIPEEKQYPDYPAVKITRLGVTGDFHNRGAGSYLIITLKKLFLTDNRTGCRFITVDAYNNSRTLNFYLKNEFRFFNDKDANKKTRHMFFDLLSVNREEIYPCPCP